MCVCVMSSRADEQTTGSSSGWRMCCFVPVHSRGSRALARLRAEAARASTVRDWLGAPASRAVSRALAELLQQMWRPLLFWRATAKSLEGSDGRALVPRACYACVRVPEPEPASRGVRAAVISNSIELCARAVCVAVACQLVHYQTMAVREATCISTPQFCLSVASGLSRLRTCP